MELSKKLCFIAIVLFLIFALGYVIALDSYSQEILKNETLKKQYDNALDRLKKETISYMDFLGYDSRVQGIIIKENFYELANSFKKFSQEDKNRLINSYPYDFAKGFKELLKQQKDATHLKTGAEVAAELFFKDENNKFILSNELKNKIWKSLEAKEQETLLQAIANNVIPKTFKNTDGTIPYIKTVSINDPNKKLKWEGLKLIGERGGYIEFDKENNNMIGSLVKEIKYDQGKFTQKYNTNIEMTYSQGTFNWEGYFISPKGTKVGKSKELGVTWGRVSENGISRREIIYTDKEAEIHLEGDIEQTFLVSKDVHGNRIWYGLNPDMQEKDGRMAEKYRAVIRIGEYTTKDGKILDDIISVKSTKIFKYGYGEDTFSNFGYAYLLGNFFNSPNEKVVEKTFQEYITSKSLKEAKELAGETAKKVGTAIGDYWKNKLNSEVPTPFGKIKLGTIESAELIGEILVMPKEAVKNIISGAAETSFVAGSEAKKQVPGIITKSIQSALSERNIYQEFDKAGENYYFFNIEPSVSSESLYTELRIGGDKYAYSDMSQFFGGKIDKIVVNNKGANGEIVWIKNGDLTLVFEGSKMQYDRNLVGNANTEIGTIINQQDEAMIKTPWSLKKDYAGAFHLNPVNTKRVDAITGANQYIAGPLATYYIGGVKIENVPQNPDYYAGNDPDYYASFELNPQIVEERRLGWRIRRNRILPQMESQASIGTNEIASELTENIRAGFQVEIDKAGGLEAFESQMQSLDSIINIYGENEFRELVKTGESPIPGFTTRELYARDVWKKINSGEFDSSMKLLAEAGTVRPGVPLHLTSTQGAILGREKIQGFDPIISNFIASEMRNREIPDKPTLSLMQAKNKAGNSGVQPMNVKEYFNGLRGSTIVQQTSQVIQAQDSETQTQAIQSQPSGSSEKSSQGCWRCNRRRCRPCS